MVKAFPLKDLLLQISLCKSYALISSESSFRTLEFDDCRSFYICSILFGLANNPVARESRTL